MSSIAFLPWLALMFPIAFSAGPNNLMCANSGATWGFRQTIPFIAGLNANIAFYSLLAGMGLGTIISEYPVVLNLIKYAGAAYILFLAWGFVKPWLNTRVETPVTCPGFWQGVIVNALNPKCFMAILLMYTSFFVPGSAPGAQVMTLTLWVVLLSMASHLTWTFMGALLLAGLKSGRILRIQKYTFAALLVAVAAWIVFS
ncbi:MAG: LysE family translocator [Bacteroidales bacterium]